MGCPCIMGLSQELRRTLRAHRVDSFVNMHHQLLCSMKDQSKMEETSSVIYQINCEVISKYSACRSTYIGETGRTLKARSTEHQEL